MSFNRRSRLDPSQVEDRRGRRGAGPAIAVGGGGLGLILTILFLLAAMQAAFDPSEVWSRIEGAEEEARSGPSLDATVQVTP